MVLVYSGHPARTLKKRASISRAVRRASKLKCSSSAKEHAVNAAIELFHELNGKVDDLHSSSNVSRSIIANIAFGGKKVKHARRVNTKNAWISKRMGEVNAGMYIFISSHDVNSLLMRTKQTFLTGKRYASLSSLANTATNTQLYPERRKPLAETR